METRKAPKAALRNRRVFTALFAALIAVSCIVQLAAGPFAVVPLVLQNMMALLAGGLLGGLGGAASVLLFVVAGALGLPVYAGGRGGIAILLGPTGGFLIGYLLGSLVIGLLLGIPSCTETKSIARIVKTAAAGLAGFLAVYVPGLCWYAASYVMKRDGSGFSAALVKALPEAFLPFIPGDLVKLVIFTLLTLALRPIAARYINPD
ncbi:MAG: biotin transporter BioY [Spirochaetaceae bacterium]|jgi:biotin transport system substrate-specific component|nr:biotin transporter BioY [Spirochaetaceae bacterium]